MKIVTDAKALKAALTAAKGTCPKSGTLPILSHGLIHATARGITLTTFDMESWVTVPVQGEAVNAGKALIPVYRIWDVVKGKGDTTPIELEVTDDSCHVVKGALSVSFETCPVDEFPNMPESPELTMRADWGAFREMAGFATDAGEHVTGNGTFTGCMLFESHDGYAYLVGTDGRRIHEGKLRGDFEGRFLLRLNAIENILRLPLEGTFRFGTGDAIDEDKFAWKCGRFSGITYLSDVTFPEYEKVIPTENHGLLTVATVDLQTAITALWPIAQEREGRDSGIFTSDGSELTITTLGEANRATYRFTGGEYGGDNMNMGLNLEFLNQGLKHCGELVTLNFDGPLSPLLYGDDDKTVVQMPVRIQE